MAHVTRTILGNALASTITSPFTASTPSPGGQFSVAAATGWPTANFVVVIDRGLATEEKVFVSARSGTILTVASGGRGFDGTIAYPHTANSAVIEPTLDALAIAALLEHVNTDAGRDHSDYVSTTNTARLPDISTLAQGNTASAGASGRYADAAHAHPMPAPPAFQTLLVNSSLSIPGTTITVTWNTTLLDSHSGVNSVTGRYTIPSGWDGDWRFEAGVEFSANATGYREVIIRKNGTKDYLARQVMAVTTASTATLVTVSGLIDGLVAGDYLQVIAGNGSGGTLTTGANDTGTWFSGRWSRPT